jgi:hypothetical protein
VAQPIATHYDNLKVQRDAPVAVIKTSYRKLSQKYHPDRNPDPGALEVMKLINLAWDVLSDPDRRARHDRAIAALERRAALHAVPPSSPGAQRTPARAPKARRTSWLDQDSVRVAGILAFFFVALFAVFQMAQSGDDDEEVPAGDNNALVQPAENAPAPAEQSDRVPHGYLNTSAQDLSPGIAVVEIDNTAGLYDAEVRLFRNGRAARSMFVHRGKRFAVEDVAPGTYVVKYKMLVDGKMQAYQERDVFQPQRDKFIKLKLKLFEAAGSKRSADQIAVDQF